MMKRPKKNGHSKAPSHLSEQDRLTLLVATERTGRLEAQTQLAHAQLQSVRQAYLEAHGAEKRLKDEMATRYRVAPQDVYHLDDGRIERRPVVEPKQEEKSA